MAVAREQADARRRDERSGSNRHVKFVEPFKPGGNLGPRSEHTS
jgi:hypothetical protein